MTVYTQIILPGLGVSKEQIRVSNKNFIIFLIYFFSLSNMPRTPVASNIRASASGSAPLALGNELEPANLSPMAQQHECGKNTPIHDGGLNMKK